MSQTEKCQLLNELVRPFGYQYLPHQDIFFSTFDAWQRKFGYMHSYDCYAPYFNMVFDSEPVYFNYNNRTWLVEFWKGQYGINTGAEIGIYCADGLVAPEARNHTFFHTISDEDIPHFAMNIKRNGQELANLSMPHWWLAAFRIGCFSVPDNLCASFCICFPECCMMQAFADALIQLGYDECSMQIHGSCICFSYRTPSTPISCRFYSKSIRYLILKKNHFFCRLYLLITRPFCCTPDRLLFLYFYLPSVFRHCLRLRRHKKHLNKKEKTKRKYSNSPCNNKHRRSNQ